jgi:TatD DNase family protein
MIDSHCHLTDERFADDVDAVIARAWDAGLTGIVTIASDADDAVAARHIAAKDARIHSTAGVHPHVAEKANDDDLARIEQMARAREIVAIGETGLDFHYDNSPRDTQLRLFEWHLRLAADTQLPIVVHCRSADDDVAALVRSAAGVRGVLHCFAGGHDLFDAAMTAGWYISFAGLVTFRNFHNQALLAAVPQQRLLVETDSPYLAPIPHRGKRNEPAYVVETCRAVASLRSADFADVARVTAENARRLYGLDGRDAAPPA